MKLPQVRVDVDVAICVNKPDVAEAFRLWQWRPGNCPRSDQEVLTVVGSQLHKSAATYVVALRADSGEEYVVSAGALRDARSGLLGNLLRSPKHRNSSKVEQAAASLIHTRKVPQPTNDKRCMPMECCGGSTIVIVCTTPMDGRLFLALADLPMGALDATGQSLLF